MSYPVFKNNEQNKNGLFYDVDDEFLDIFNTFMACNSGLTTQEYVKKIDFYNFTQETLVGFFKLINTHKNTYHKICGPFRFEKGRWWSNINNTQTIDSLRKEVNKLTKELVRLQIENDKLKTEVDPWISWTTD